MNEYALSQAGFSSEKNANEGCEIRNLSTKAIIWSFRKIYIPLHKVFQGFGHNTSSPHSQKHHLSLSPPHIHPIKIRSRSPSRSPSRLSILVFMSLAACHSLLEDAMAHVTRNISAKLTTTTANTCRRKQ